MILSLFCRNHCIFGSVAPWRSFLLPFAEWPIRWAECVSEIGSKCPMGEEGELDRRYWCLTCYKINGGGEDANRSTPWTCLGLNLHRIRSSSIWEGSRPAFLGFEECDDSLFWLGSRCWTAIMCRYKDDSFFFFFNCGRFRGERRN